MNVCTQIVEKCGCHLELCDMVCATCGSGISSERHLQRDRRITRCGTEVVIRQCVCVQQESGVYRYRYETGVGDRWRTVRDRESDA